MSNHLGNVLTTFYDVLLAKENPGQSPEAYAVTISSTADYSTFGVQLDGRTQNAGGYRYGFQGQERDDEVKGDGNSVNYKFRMHDPRIGGFFAVDPLTGDYPWNSPYAFSENVVINAVELEGLERRYTFNSAYLSEVYTPLILNGNFQEVETLLQNLSGRRFSKNEYEEEAKEHLGGLFVEGGGFNPTGEYPAPSGDKAVRSSSAPVHSENYFEVDLVIKNSKGKWERMLIRVNDKTSMMKEVSDLMVDVESEINRLKAENQSLQTSKESILKTEVGSKGNSSFSLNNSNSGLASYENAAYKSGNFLRAIIKEIKQGINNKDIQSLEKSLKKLKKQKEEIHKIPEVQEIKR